MNYSKDMERCVDYIESNLQNEISTQMLADEIGYSVYHFCRVFSACKGMPPTEYIRKRRLSLAALELFQNKKIIDIALNYGFETAGGFAKAFRKEYGYSPAQYAKRMAGFNQATIKNKIGDYIMNYVIMKKPAFKVAGYGIQTDISSANYTKDIASFWEHYEGENLESKLYEILNPPKHGEVGLCIPASENGNVTYLLGVIVDDFSKVTDDMITVEVPQAEYAVFTTPPVDTTNDNEQKEFAQVIKSTWKYIFEQWFIDSGYVYDEDKLDFEFYDERCHFRPDTVMDIFVPIKKRL
ncbi:AraC family transcriptional regulator [Hydrogenoanaerobacterium saccharovorans]|uniref:Transcriptional regulator, AraC family n=1 Tax=Hydrogenoanaerobacterium saccharovorans TaxID=474960 RepID=A0A1H8CNZ1_9FIRM|nr:AraC family transcriptional regulator [Hydrogenoanaerobacterium saccharovorans]RPF43235.1 AraC family transcriptional regulator [Hydrogenoanaerobacterium saccharovorans]SEM96750.1 transcriptional regulator, AraC family [Hydrogenoanaerobacterium saccharovorans]